MTFGDMLQYAMRIAGILGVGQTPLDQDTADAQIALDAMFKQWQRRRWIVFRLDDLVCRLDTGRPTYTVGPGGDFDIAHRPGSIEGVFLRQLAGGGPPGAFPVDYPMRIISSRQEWNAIPLKGLRSWPAQIFYDPTLPVGTLYIWPVPVQTLFELHITPVQDILWTDPGTDTDTFLPGEAEEAIIYNLASRLRVNYRLPPDPGIMSLAQSSLNTLRTNNFALRPLRMPAGLRSPSRVKNPMAGFYPEANAGIPFPVLS